MGMGSTNMGYRYDTCQMSGQFRGERKEKRTMGYDGLVRRGIRSSPGSVCVLRMCVLMGAVTNRD